MVTMLLAMSVACPGAIFYARGVPVCVERHSVRRERKSSSFYVQQRTKYIPARKPTHRAIKPFASRISDVRSARARRAAVYNRFIDDKESHIKRIIKTQKRYSDKRKRR